MNVVNLIGRTTAEVDLRYLPDGKAVGNFTLAVNRLKKEDGADFIRCEVWGKTAENMSNYVRKGHRVGIRGRLKTGPYVKDGVKHYTMDVVAAEVEFLESKPKQPKDFREDLQGDLQEGYEIPEGYEAVDDDDVPV